MEHGNTLQVSVEKNGSLKVYVNGTLDASRYEKNIKDLKDGTLTVEAELIFR